MIDPIATQNNNTARYISADEIANGARAFKDAMHTNKAARHPMPVALFGRTNNSPHNANPTMSTKRTTPGSDAGSNTDQRPG